MTELRAVPDLPEPKRRGGHPKGPRCPADAGPLLKTTWLEINEMALTGREADRWREVALMAAKTAEDSMKDGKPAHFNPAIKVLTDAMDRLHAIQRKAGDGDGDILGGLGSFGATGS